MIELRCTDFPAALAALEQLGLRVDMIMPADAPHLAELSNGDVALRLVGPAPERARDTGWHTGRAGMQYRDLVPDRVGGRLIASHIRVPDGGAVPDYVHYHEVAFQMIYCYRGWVRLVYEDQGPAFVMSAGECVLQPPRIRHRVLECSAGLEVVEIASPAAHPTFADHALALPTAMRERAYGDQRFAWLRRGFSDDAMTIATNGLARVRIRRGVGPITPGGLTFGFVLAGSIRRDGQLLGATEAFVGGERLTDGSSDLEWLEVRM